MRRFGDVAIKVGTDDYESNWIYLISISDWDDVLIEIQDDGFDLDRADELRITDLMGFKDNLAKRPVIVVTWLVDYLPPEEFVYIMTQSGILEDSTNGLAPLFAANYIDNWGFSEWVDLVRDMGVDNWFDNMSYKDIEDKEDIATFFIEELKDVNSDVADAIETDLISYISWNDLLDDRHYNTEIYSVYDNKLFYNGTKTPMNVYDIFNG